MVNILLAFLLGIVYTRVKINASILFCKLVRVTITQERKIVMEDMKETIGRNIRILRKQKGQTLKSLSSQIGVTHQQLSRIENGQGTSTATLERISAVLGVDMKTLIDEPEANLHKVLPQTKNYVPDQLCNQMYADLYANVIKRTNDIAIGKFMEEVIEKLVKDKSKIRNLMCSHVGDSNHYEFTPSELQDFCQLLFADFADHAMRLSKNNYDEEQE